MNESIQHDRLIDPAAARAFIDAILRNPVNRALLGRMPGWGLEDCWLVAGCLFQTAWNLRSGRPPGEGIRDYDVFYFDRDLSWDAEDRVIARVNAACADLGVVIEVKNQARVHLWYGERFGPGYPALRSCRDGVDRFLSCATCVAVRPTGDGVELYAPYGLVELDSGILRPNPRNLRGDRFAAKAASYRARWPWLTVVDQAGSSTTIRPGSASIRI